MNPLAAEEVLDVAAEPAPAARREFHATILALSIAVIALACLMTTVNERQVAFAGWSQFPLPPLCQSQLWFGVDCPGCGLTRSFIHFFHGHWDASFHAHRLGGLLAVLTLLQIPYRLAALALSLPRPLGAVFPNALIAGTAALLVVNWLLKLTGR